MTFKDARLRLHKEFEALKADTVRGFIHKANKHLEELLEHVFQ